MTEPGHDAQVIAHLQIEGFVAAELNDDVDYTISPENICFHYQKIYLQDQSIQKYVNFIF